MWRKLILAFAAASVAAADGAAKPAFLQACEDAGDAGCAAKLATAAAGDDVATVAAALAAGADPFPALENATLATRSLLAAAGYNNACEGVSPGERKRLGVHCVPRWYHAYLPWVEYTGRNALIIGLGIFPVVFVVMYVAAKLSGPLFHETRHVRKSRRPAARAPAHEALLRAIFQTNVARLAFGVLRARLARGRDCLFVLLLDLFGVVKPGRRRRGGFVELGLGHNQE